MTIRRRLQIGNLRNDFRFDPNNVAFRFSGHGCKCAGLPPDLLKAGQQRAECLVIETRSNPTTIDQLALVELADQQRAEGASLLVGQAIPADDELILTDTFGFDSHRAAA